MGFFSNEFWKNTLKIQISLKTPFLDASSHLYKRLCPYVGRWVKILINIFINKNISPIMSLFNLDSG